MIGPVEFYYKGNLVVCNKIDEFENWDFDKETNSLLE